MNSVRLSLLVPIGLLAGCTQHSSQSSASAPPAPALSAAATPVSADPADLATSAQWKLIELNGQPVNLSADQKAPTISFDTKNHRETGFSGVNRFSGGYAAVGGALTFGPIAGTRMAGPQEAMDLESAYLAALGRTTGWRIASGRLDLMAGTAVTARFEKQAVTKP